MGCYYLALSYLRLPFVTDHIASHCCAPVFLQPTPLPGVAYQGCQAQIFGEHGNLLSREWDMSVTKDPTCEVEVDMPQVIKYGKEKCNIENILAMTKIQIHLYNDDQ
jgi:hypothetical protein